jgi:hypothetical protein
MFDIDGITLRLLLQLYIFMWKNSPDGSQDFVLGMFKKKKEVQNTWKVWLVNNIFIYHDEKFSTLWETKLLKNFFFLMNANVQGFLMEYQDIYSTLLNSLMQGSFDY